MRGPNRPGGSCGTGGAATTGVGRSPDETGDGTYASPAEEHSVSHMWMQTDHAHLRCHVAHEPARGSERGSKNIGAGGPGGGGGGCAWAGPGA